MQRNVLIVHHQREDIIRMLNDCLLEDNTKSDLCVDWLARLLHMSRPTLYRKVKSITGLTPNELINEARLKRAADLLATSGHRACKVAKMVGYTSQSSFGKSFLKQFKMTPATYQRKKKMMDVA